MAVTKICSFLNWFFAVYGEIGEVFLGSQRTFPSSPSIPLESAGNPRKKFNMFMVSILCYFIDGFLGRKNDNPTFLCVAGF